jgi:hypothetical protein
MLEYQQHVVDEKRDLDQKLLMLEAFCMTDTFAALNDMDRGLLSAQKICMESYSGILGLRIAQFAKAKHV